MFPVSIEGQVQVQANLLDPAMVDYLYENIEDRLKSERASNIWRESGKLKFRVGLFRFVSNWNVLVSIDSGEFEVIPGNPGSVKYRFSLVQMLVVVTIMSGLFWMMGIRGGDIMSGFSNALFAWAWLFGANYVISLIRLPSFVQKAVSI